MIGATIPSAINDAERSNMRNEFVSLQYYEAYSHASAVRNILYNHSYYLHELSEFNVDDNHLGFARPFPRRSALHEFISFVIDNILREEFPEVDLDYRKQQFLDFKSMPEAQEDLRPHILPVDDALASHGIEYESFETWLTGNGKNFADAEETDVEEFLEELFLTEQYDQLLKRYTDEVFFVVFQNRKLLLFFNVLMSWWMCETKLVEIDEEYRSYFKRDGVLKRSRIPEWVRRAVFFRDRGKCTICRSDISGTVSILNSKHFDHIVPLSDGGLNDVSNIQLLCESCNLRKSAGEAITSSDYEAWYRMEDDS